MTDEPSSQLSSEEVEALHAQHAESLRHYLMAVTGNAEDTNDCLQSTFAIAQQRGGSCAVGARRAWLFRVGYNEAMQLFRRKKITKTKHDDSEIQEAECNAASPVDQMLRAEKLAQVRRALNTLSPEFRTVVTLRIDDGLKFREIAERMDLPLGTVLARMQSALRKLSEKLQDE